MLDLMRGKKLKERTGGEKGRHLRPWLVQKNAEGKTSYQLGWKVKVTIKKIGSRALACASRNIHANELRFLSRCPHRQHVLVVRWR